MPEFILFGLIAFLILGEMRYNTQLRNRVSELEEQVKGMIPMPKVEVYECDSSWYIRINGSDVLAEDPMTYLHAQLWLERVTQTLKGGE